MSGFPLTCHCPLHIDFLVLDLHILELLLSLKNSTLFECYSYAALVWHLINLKTCSHKKHTLDHDRSTWNSICKAKRVLTMKQFCSCDHSASAKLIFMIVVHAEVHLKSDATVGLNVKILATESVNTNF